MTKTIPDDVKAWIEKEAEKFADAGQRAGRLKDLYYDTYYDYITGATAMYNHLQEQKDKEIAELKARTSDLTVHFSKEIKELRAENNHLQGLIDDLNQQSLDQ